MQGQEVAGLIETVLIPVAPHGKQRPRTTLCVSSQVGCAMNCQFCYTGRMGLRYCSSQCAVIVSMGCNSHHDYQLIRDEKVNGRLCYTEGTGLT